MSVVYIPSILSSKMKHPARRCLFERPTSDKQEKDFETQESRLFDQDNKLFKEKWGLDPKTGSTFSGAEYECVPVDLTKESIPSFYTKGYAPRKPRPVQSLRRERSHFGFSIPPTRLNFDCPRSLKRRLPFEDEGNDYNRDENREIIYDENNTVKRVPIDGEVVITASGSISSNCSSSSPSSPFSAILDVSVSNSPISLPISSYLLHSHEIMKASSMPEISPRSTDLCTPQQRPRSLTQKTIKDYLPCKKSRCVAKILPRT